MNAELDADLRRQSRETLRQGYDRHNRKAGHNRASREARRRSYRRFWRRVLTVWKEVN